MLWANVLESERTCILQANVLERERTCILLANDLERVEDMHFTAPFLD